MRLRCLPIAVALALSGAAAGAERPLLRVGMETREPPWAFVPEAVPDMSKPPSLKPAEVRRLIGFDVDVMKALGVRLEAEMRVVPTAWADLEAGLLAKRYDLILSSWTPNAHTSDAIAASPPYCEWGLLVVVRAEDTRIRSLADLDRTRVGHFRDPAVGDALFAMGRGRFEVRDTLQELFADLEAGELDAVIYDSLHVRWLVARNPRLRTVGTPLNTLGYHVGVRREDAGLVERVRAAVRDLVASGEMQKLRRRWEGS